MISTEKLKVVYKSSRVEAVKEASIYIPSNATTCIIGPNASGKTTLLKAIADLVDYSGTIIIDGRDARSLSHSLRRMLAYASTIVSEDLLGIKVVDVLMTSRYPVSRGIADRKEDLDEIKSVSRLLGIDKMLDRKICELSSGELQRVVIAAALVRKPRILLLDEPDSHLDVATKPWMSNLLRSVASDCTVVVSTHDVIFAFHTCDFFVVLSNGRVVFSGFYSELVADPKPLEEAYGVKFVPVRSGSRVVLVPLYLDRATEISERGQ